MADEQHERLLENADGTIVIRLRKSAKLGGEEHDRLTVHEFTAKLLPKLEKMHQSGGEPSLEAMLELAEDLSTPKGIVGELRSHADVELVVDAVNRQAGKYQDG